MSPKRPPKKWPVALAAVIGLTLLIVRMLDLIGGDRIEPGLTPLPLQPEVRYRSARVEKRARVNAPSWPGFIRPLHSARIAPKLNARILAVAVREGDRVNRGDVLVRLDSAQPRALESAAAARRAAANADRERASADLQRTRTLFEQDAATRETYDHAQAEARRAEAALQAAAQNVREAATERGETLLIAPFDGVIAERLHEPGDMGRAGEPIIVLHDPSALRLEAAVPAACADRIRPDDPVRVRIDAFESVLEAGIDEIAPAADPQTGTVPVKVRLPAQRNLQPGLFGWLEGVCGTPHAALWIPETALRRIGQVETVTVLDGTQPVVRHVRAGIARDGQIEVLSGLDAGETVVLP